MEPDTGVLTTPIHRESIRAGLCRASGGRVSGFTGRYRWLSNFAPGVVFVPLMRTWFPTREAAYQAGKCPERKSEFAAASSGMAAKLLGQAVPLPPDWTAQRESWMRRILLAYFCGSALPHDWLYWPIEHGGQPIPRMVPCGAFSRNGPLLYTTEEGLRDRRALIATGDAYLEHVNNHGDLFWGVSASKSGKNRLGILLMEVRNLAMVQSIERL